VTSDARPPCPSCEGCGQVADTDSREPWSHWLDLPLRSAVAVVAGIVRPIPCPDCGGTGLTIDVRQEPEA
jgi:hypothetical protein